MDTVIGIRMTAEERRNQLGLCTRKVKAHAIGFEMIHRPREYTEDGDR